jgi:hypothetical protein
MWKLPLDNPPPNGLLGPMKVLGHLGDRELFWQQDQPSINGQLSMVNG